MSQLQFDADAARRIEALYQIHDAVHRRELVREALGAVLADRILDVGCGPGFYCLADPSLPRTLGAQLRSAGFEDVRVEAHVFAASGSDPEKYGAALVPFIATFVAGRQGIGEVEAEAWGAEQRELMERDEFYFASTQFCFTATKSA